MEVLSIFVWTIKDIIGLSLAGIVLLIVLCFAIYYYSLKLIEWVKSKFKKGYRKQ